jgi:hypothetical protein
MSLDNDTGAFIVDKRVLPGKPINGELKLELYYVVGWPDLPAARVAILATRILDYVSPWTLEDWEYNSSLEKDREEQRQEAEQNRKRQERAKIPLVSTPVSGTSTPGAPGQMRRGRPSKAEVLARQIAQQASFGDEELANVSLPPTRTDGPSLSTPQKRLAQLATDVEDLEDTDTNEAIYKQLQGGGESDSDSQVVEGFEELEEPQTNSGFTSLNSFLPAPSSRGYAQFPVSDLPLLAQNDPSWPAPLVPVSLFSHSKKKSSRWPETQLTTPVPVPSNHKQPQEMPVLLEKVITPVPVPSYPHSQLKSSKEKHAVSATPVPAPAFPALKTKSQKIAYEMRCTSVPVPIVPKAKSNIPRGVTLTPVPPPLYPPHLSGPPGEPHRVKCTPVPPPFIPPVLLNGTTRTHGGADFIPASQSSKKWLPKAEIKTQHNAAQTHSRLDSATPIVEVGSTHKKKRPKLEEEQVWEVERLEGDKELEIEGQTFRYFKVRWKGNWPAGQNPTWEPEENISEGLIKKYIKNKHSKIAQNHSSPRTFERATPSQKRKYSSVVEAFQGDVDDEPMPTSSLVGDSELDQDDVEEHFQVTEQKSRAGSQSRKHRVDPALVRELAASFSFRSRVTASHSSEF